MADSTRILLLGKTGSGKSSLANTILGDNVFTVNHSPNSETSACRSVTRRVWGRSLTLIDTPGLFDTHPNRPGFNFERFLEVCSPGPHAVLFVLKIERYTEQEEDVVNYILQYFSPGVLRYTTLVFTRGDSLPPGVTIEEWAEQNDSLGDLLQRVGHRCHVVDNEYWRNQGQTYRNNQNRVRDLLNTIDQAVAENGGTFYTNEVLQTPSLWSRFMNAPLIFKIAAVLGVAAVGYLLYHYVPWGLVMEWVRQAAVNGVTWIGQNVPNNEGLRRAIEYLANVLILYNQIQHVRNAVQESVDAVPVRGIPCPIM